MRGALLLSLLFLAVSSQTVQKWGTCTFCNYVVSKLADYATKTITKEDLLKDITSVSQEVCPKIPSEFITSEECSSFISLYAPYTIDMILSQTEPSQICSTLQLCDSSDPTYQVIFPTIDKDNKKVVYEFTQKDVSKKGEKFYYKIFLGNPSFLQDDTLTVQLSNNINADFYVNVTNKVLSNHVECMPQTGIACTLMIANPGRGTWYYIEVTANSFLYPNSTQFTLNAIVQNEIVTHYMIGKAKVNYLPIFLPITLIGMCLTCCCCVRRKRVCKRVCKRAAQQESKEVQAQEMTPMPVTGYYYPVPNGEVMYSPQYVPVDQYPQSVPVHQYPQSVFIPIAQPE